LLVLAWRAPKQGGGLFPLSGVCDEYRVLGVSCLIPVFTP